MLSIFYTVTCQKRKAELIEKESEQNINAFLATSLNTEMVVAILKGICMLAAGSSDNVDHISEKELFKVRQKTLIEIDSIKILNAKKWEDGVHGRTSQPDPVYENDLMEEIVLGSSDNLESDTSFGSSFVQHILGINMSMYSNYQTSND